MCQTAIQSRILSDYFESRNTYSHISEYTEDLSTQEHSYVHAPEIKPRVFSKHPPLLQTRFGESKSHLGESMANFRCNPQFGKATLAVPVHPFINHGGQQKHPTFPSVKAGSCLNDVRKGSQSLWLPIFLCSTLLLPISSDLTQPSQYSFVWDPSEPAYHPGHPTCYIRGHKVMISDVSVWPFRVNPGVLQSKTTTARQN